MSFESVKDIFEKENLFNLVVLTYELDERALFDVCLSGSQVLNGIGSVRPVIFYDPRKTPERFKAPPTVELIPFKKSGGKHHSKAYLFSTEDKVHLILGSLNLTSNGLLRNREVFKHFKWSKRETEDISLLREFISFLKEQYSLTESTNLAETIEAIESMSSGWDSEVSRFNLVHSGYDNNGLDSIKEIWRSRFGDKTPNTLIVISPFFDSEQPNILTALKKHDLMPTDISVITHRGNATKLPITKGYYRKAQELCHFSIYESENRVDSSTEEWSIIKNSEAKKNNKIKDEDVFVRQLHAKILIFNSEETSLVYFGSGNFTNNAWQGRNYELGVTSWIDNAQKDELLKSLGESYNFEINEKDEASLSERLELDDEGDDFAALNVFPDFIKSIKLVNNSSNEIQFHFEVQSESEKSFNDYEVFWGSDKIALNENDSSSYNSQIFNFKESLNLLMGRTLKFSHKESGQILFYPYSFNQAIIEAAKKLFLGDSNDYIESFLGDISFDFDYEQEIAKEMFGDAKPEEEIVSDVNRNDNLSIKMQRFISLLPRLELKIKSLLADFENSKVKDDRERKRYLHNPLLEIIEALLTDYEIDQNLSCFIYKLGEISLIIKNIRSSELNFISNKIESIISESNLKKGSDSYIKKEYLRYVFG